MRVTATNQMRFEASALNFEMNPRNDRMVLNALDNQLSIWDFEVNDSIMLSSSQLAALHNYTVDYMIGEGSYSQVYMAEHISTHARCAIKIVPRNCAQAESEINILSSLSHRSCVRLHEVLSDDGFHYLVTDHISNGTLLQHINHSHTFTEHDARHIFVQLFDGIRYLHEVRRIAHLDLKLENIMIDSKSEVKIIDFGHARPFDMLPEMSGHIRCGSLPYWAPEIASGRQITPSVDVWSMGVILYALVTGTFPFYSTDISKQTARILFDEVTFPRDVSPEFRSLISKMLEKESANRITLSEIAGEAWMHGNEFTTSARKGFALPPLEFLHPLPPGEKRLPLTLKRGARLLEIEQGLMRMRNGRKTHCTHSATPMKLIVRRQSG
jgi:serine/threonine protein kinase